MVKSDLTADIELLRKGSPNPINLNEKFEIDNREKLLLLSGSRTFLILATVLTFGIYYAYYKFRLSDLRNPNPTVYSLEKIAEDLKSKRDTFVEFQNLEIFSSNLNALVEGKVDKKKKYYRKLNVKKINFLVALGVLFSMILSFPERLYSKLTRKSLNFDPIDDIQTQRLEQHVEKERRMIAHLSKLLNSSQPTINSSFDFESRIIKTLSADGEGGMVSHYMKFIFF